MATGADVRAWKPPIPGVAEVLHAHFTDHAYPLHTHDTWTVLIVDSGAVAYQLDRGQYDALRQSVTVLPPHVAHSGRPATAAGFRKRVLYLEADQLAGSLIGRAVDTPAYDDRPLRTAVAQVHDVLRHPGDELEAESLLALATDRLECRLRRAEPTDTGRDRKLATRLRELLDSRIERGIGLDEAGRLLDAHPTHLIRTFGRAYGLPPHRYVNGRRLDRARRMLLAGRIPAEVAAEVGYVDQAHLTRHFKQFLGVTPAAYARSGV